MIQYLIIVLLLVLWLYLLAGRMRAGAVEPPPPRAFSPAALLVSLLLPLPHGAWPAAGLHCPYS